MMDAIGYLETAGLPNAIVAADKMLKTASVGLLGIENTKGGGWVTVGIHGDVAAVSVAVEAARQALGAAYVGSTVLANPAPGVQTLSHTPIFPQASASVAAPAPDVSAPTATSASPAKSQTAVVKRPTAQPVVPTPAQSTPPTSTDPAAKPVAKPSAKRSATQPATCNLCNDPACPRKLGEPRKKCIHYQELFGKKK